VIRPFIYNAIVNRVVDGDTIDVDIDLGFDTWMMKQRIRLSGVDAPESRTRDLNEKKFGFLAKSIVEGFCPVGAKVLIETELDSKGKFGRILGVIWVHTDIDVNVNEYLITERYAVRYHGQAKSDIAQAHLDNYTYLIENNKI